MGIRFNKIERGKGILKPLNKGEKSTPKNKRKRGGKKISFNFIEDDSSQKLKIDKMYIKNSNKNRDYFV